MIKADIKLDLSKLQSLAPNLAKNALKRSVRVACKQIIQDVKSAAPIDTGALRQSISSKIDSIKGEVNAYGVVGPRSAFKKKTSQPARYAHFVEAKTHFLTNAWASGKDKYAQTLIADLAIQIEKELAK